MNIPADDGLLGQKDEAEDQRGEKREQATVCGHLRSSETVLWGSAAILNPDGD
jgi:hypothetical protein